MTSQLDLIRRAEALASKTASGSITPEELGLLIRDVTTYIASVEREGGQLGVRKVYTSVDAMRADSSPLLPDGRPLRPGNLVAIYDTSSPSSPESGSIYVYLGDGWTEVAHLDIHLANDYSDADKAKVDLLHTDAGEDHYLAGDGTYKPIHVPEAPVKSVSVGGIPVAPDDSGNVDLTIPKAPVQGVSVNGTPSQTDESGIIHLDIKSGTVQSILLNGERLTPDEAGSIAISIDQVAVDESLSLESTNAVSNAAVTTKLTKIEKATIAGMDAERSADGETITLKLTNNEGGEVASVEFPAGGKGSGGGDQQTTRILLLASVSDPAVKVGDSATLSYTYRHVSADSDESPTGVQATIRLSIRRGATQLLEQTIPDVSAGTYTLDLTPYLTQAGTLDVQVLATATNAEGKTQKRTIATSVSVYALTLASSYSVASGLPGYAPSDILTIPYAVTGIGSKTITCYIDGVSHSTQSVTRSGTTNGTIQIPLRGQLEGRHTAQLVAEVAVGGKEIRSESLYLDYYIGKDDDLPRIGVMLRNRDGRILEGDAHLTPRLFVEQFTAYSFSYALYDPQRQPAELSLKVGDAEALTLTLGRTSQEYASRSVTSGAIPVRLSARQGVSYDLTLDIAEGRVNVTEVTDSLTLALSALGRSNAEGNPATWVSGGIATTFERFDWGAGGWDGTALRLVNGSSIAVLTPFFSSDPMASGGTLELEVRMDNALSSMGAVVSCLDANGMGLLITGRRAELRTASGTVVATDFAEGEYYRLAFVVSPKAEARILEIYINGIRSGAVSYGQSDSLLHALAIPLRVSSEFTDVSLRAVRTYSRALSDDEVLSNYIASRPDASEVVSLYERNDILGDDGAVSMDKLRRQGKSVLRIVGNVPLINETNNKKYEEKVDIYFYSGFGKQYDFVCRGAGLRIQGTSSTTYPRKNYRIYLDRKKKYGTTLSVGGVEQTELKYAFTPGAVPVSIFTIKADFAESSSTHNTGLAKLIDETYRKAGILTPPQKKNAGVRIGIDGFPMDAFFDLSGSGENTYLGKYNFNNDKSGSEAVFGFEGEDCICLEFLNNSEPLALFGTDNMASFKTALEFRHPDGVEWDTATEKQKSAVRRLWQWVRSCEGNPTKFKREVTGYFDVDSLTGWYVLTEYFMMVDQRAKNMMLATWDGLHWHFEPYDNDCLFGERNDGVLKYTYTIDENTFDETIGSYAYAGHDSLLWQLVREALPDKLQETAQKIRATMSKERVLEILNGQFMSNWSERVYNKDGEYKYLKPYISRGIDYLYCLQGSRYAHRTAMINDRFSLLDAKYLAGTYRADALRLYFAHAFSKDNRSLHITASDRYYFGYGYTSKAPQVSGVRAESAGSKIALTLTTDLIVNDPQNIYGASRMAELDLTEVSPYIVGTANFDRCTRLSKLNLACPSGQTTLTAVTLSACRLLEELDVSGLQSPLFRSLDLSTNHRLRKLNASSTVLTDIVLSSGAPITELRLPETLTSLRLRHLPSLTLDGIRGMNAEVITRLWWEDCPGIPWETLLERLPKVTNLRIVGIDREGDVAWLNRFIDKGGITASGALTSTCALVGTYRLTQYLPEEEFARLAQHFPELSIRQPEYTVVGYVNQATDRNGFPQDVLASDRWFNRDNSTGYGTGRAYEPSGHLLRIASKRHRWRGIEEKRGEMHVYPLRDDHSGYYADGASLETSTPTNLADASEGGIWVNEPHYWYKGIHDGETKTDYQVYSSQLEMPRLPEGKLYDHEAIVRDLKPMRQYYVRCPRGSEGKHIEELLYKYRAGYTQGEENSGVYSVIKIPVAGFKRVKFPICNNGISNSDDLNQHVEWTTYKQPAPFQDRPRYEVAMAISSVFVNAEGKAIKIIRLPAKEYPRLFRDFTASIPEGATHLYTSVFTDFIDEEMEVWLTNSERPEDWEPHWQEHREEWISAVPLHWQEGETFPEMTLGEAKKLGDMTTKKYRFFYEHGAYDQVTYEEFKDLRNLVWAWLGDFNLRKTLGRTINGEMQPGSWGGWYTIPELGMGRSYASGMTPTSLDGRRKANLPTIFGYTWISGAVPLQLSPEIGSIGIAAHTKDKGVRGTNIPRGVGLNIGAPYSQVFTYEEWRHFQGKPRRILFTTRRDDAEGYQNNVGCKQVVGGRHLDILCRAKDNVGWDIGCCGENLPDAGGDNHALGQYTGSWYSSNNDNGFYNTPSARWNFLVPIFRGKVIRASSPSELRKLTQYKFLLTEKPNLTQW